MGDKEMQQLNLQTGRAYLSVSSESPKIMVTAFGFILLMLHFERVNVKRGPPRNFSHQFGLGFLILHCCR